MLKNRENRWPERRELYLENLLHFNLADFPVNFIKQLVSCFFWYRCLYEIFLLKFLLCYWLYYFTKNIAYHITEVLIFYADKLMMIGSSNKFCVFNFTILLKSQKKIAKI